MPVPAAPVATWTGFYFGANGGYALNMVGTVLSRGVVNNCTDFLAVACTGGVFNGPNVYGLASSQAADFNTPTHQNGGFLGGGQFGYNYQFGTKSVIGLE